ncbi:amidohydrolase family protein [Dactylosporangium roseum]|uniref:Amidohydrolase family protein n=1 Tax=Dactylosporangium roseum TaxID=47989 RepID=A0ABY5Z1P4_9ACTN|nr:amidohydrolase family protein [Dactylosporangium roseum]UWZ34424.1 amidohydrolase family protein [Dactylosporangium roseum]
MDGTGAAPYTADIGIKDGVIAEIGDLDDRSGRTIDGDGAVAMPGFVDMHTHFDAQATWAQHMQPASWHGVTTAVMGNCGVGFAPVVPADRDRLVKLMEGVEDIPGVVLQEGLEWNWNSFPEYLDAVDGLRHDMDLAAQLPHAPLRVRVMGERALAREPATDEDIDKMAAIAAEAFAAGAVGFSTSRLLNHKSRAGEVIPSYGAGQAELVAIARALGRGGRGAFQLVSDFDDLDVDFGLIEAIVEASNVPLSFTLVQRKDEPELYTEILRRIAALNRSGHKVRGQVAARAIGMIMGLHCTLHPFMTNPVWKAEISRLPVPEQIRVMRRDEVRAAILSAQNDELVPSLIGGAYLYRWADMYELADPPNYEPGPTESLVARARTRGVTPAEICYDILVRDEQGGMIYLPSANYAYGSLDVARQLIRNEYTLPGLSDAGAHVGTICDASFPTTMLQSCVTPAGVDWDGVRDFVRRQARSTAEFVGLTDRGILAPGYKADLNVVDLRSLAVGAPYASYDLPSGGRRLLQRATGYLYTVVSGAVTYRDGVPTGELPGRLVRSRWHAAA